MNVQRCRAAHVQSLPYKTNFAFMRAYELEPVEFKGARPVASRDLMDAGYQM